MIYHKESMPKSEVINFGYRVVELPKKSCLQIKHKLSKLNYYFLSLN